MVLRYCLLQQAFQKLSRSRERHPLEAAINSDEDLRQMAILHFMCGSKRVDSTTMQMCSGVEAEVYLDVYYCARLFVSGN